MLPPHATADDLAREHIELTEAARQTREARRSVAKLVSIVALVSVLAAGVVPRDRTQQPRVRTIVLAQGVPSFCQSSCGDAAIGI